MFALPSEGRLFPFHESFGILKTFYKKVLSGARGWPRDLIVREKSATFPPKPFKITVVIFGKV